MDLLHSEVMSWLKKNTRSSVGSRYGTSRNVTEQMVKWRKKASMQIVTIIQKVCAKMMNVFGYTKANSTFDLHDFSHNLLVSNVSLQ